MQKHPMLSLKVALLLFVVLSVLCASEGEKATRGDVCHPTYVGMSLFITLTFVSSFISLEWHVFRSKNDVVKVGLRLFFFFLCNSSFVFNTRKCLAVRNFATN